MYSLLQEILDLITDDKDDGDDSGCHNSIKLQRLNLATCQMT